MPRILNAACRRYHDHNLRTNLSQDLRDEVGGGTAMGGRPDLQEEIQDAEKPEAKRSGLAIVRPARSGPAVF